MTSNPSRISILRAPELRSDVLVVRRTEEGHRLIGRQLGGAGRVQQLDEAFTPQPGRRIELYSSDTDIGRARLRRLPAPLREFLRLELSDHPHVDVLDVDDVPLDIDGYI